jgi:hypothetical protein
MGSEVDCCSGYENGGAFEPAGADIGEGLVSAHCALE